MVFFIPLRKVLPWLAAISCVVVLSIHVKSELPTLNLKNVFGQVIFPAPRPPSASGEEPFRWSTVPPLNYLQWQDCIPGRQCARLIVPLNYSEPEGREAVIALIRKPAAVPAESESYLGPILLNPGGPGGSGVDLIVRAGDSLSVIIGPEFDIVGFDPRGIGRSTPQVLFLKTGVERELWKENLIINASDGSIGRSLAKSRLLNRLALEQDNETLAFINTDHTARDMLRIVEAHGQQKIKYWGFSYGTVLGATFAAMFPDRIDRLVIDAVVDSEEWYKGIMSNELRDTDKAFTSFFDACWSAGPERCAFYAPTPEDIRHNLTRLSGSILQSPLPVHTKSGYGLIDYAGLRVALFRMLYKPHAQFELFAQGLADLARGNGTLLFQLGPFQKSYKCECCKKDYWDVDVDDAGVAVLCNDGKPVVWDEDAAKEHIEKTTKQSEFAHLNLLFQVERWGCVDWPRFSKEHLFQGQFNVTTSHPLLVVGNTADPITPLASARKMSQLFQNSSLLTQNSTGHGSVSAPSLCTQNYIRQYFLSGTVPPSGTVCQPVRGPFDRDDEVTLGSFEEDLQLPLLADDLKLLSAVKELGTSLNQMRHFLPFAI
ncbi:TAP-like protein-domain-containing protein [Crepidotus variabilis]|uniref:TAP-like protein-domain-containing protein n=1 Tax=Crepidotus variabilis TaxID=179855 RepID=A0A9P6ERQ3_9AGAR|nr:TAP-like protein-domain-containing protein [Crepidotus variabilis]